ncbi:WSC domain-containing protein [Lentinula guzmanii]|uniref:WSC domain-containing protein n=1 Tax=Lentinula guzmanii TaxID=2804957 RepID=A0AA38J3I3_9AGAR|nr:WSC domain-containing protein [Lentinula guzmanii]
MRLDNSRTVLTLLSTLITLGSASLVLRGIDRPDEIALDSRQAPSPVNQTGNWSLVGCYTDISTARTLSAATIPASDNMTLETCVAFCSSVDFIFAGVEFAQECYCDSTIQIPGVPSDLADCDLSCSGNSSELCGGSDNILIYTNGQPAPVIVQDVGQWSYAGCFTDSVEDRDLSIGIDIPAGVTAASCSAACQTENFNIAGLENGQECWCGNVLSNSSIHVGDDDCRNVCISDHSEYCGAPNRLAVYDFTALGAPPPPTTCSSDNIANFTLIAKYKNPPEDGSSGEVPLKIVLVEMVPSVTWAILSGCELCCSDWPTYSLQNSIFLPHSLSNPGQLMVSSAPGPGESPNFVASDPAFPGFQAYCATDAAGQSDNQPLLAFGDISNAFALCTNTSVNANGRLDVVFEPVSNHLHYVLDDCIPITIEIAESD